MNEFKCQFTKNRKTGAYDVTVPADAKPGDIVPVYKKNGDVEEVRLGRVGKAFEGKYAPNEGVMMAIAVIDHGTGDATPESGSVCPTCNQVIPTNTGQQHPRGAPPLGAYDDDIPFMKMDSMP